MLAIIAILEDGQLLAKSNHETGSWDVTIALDSFKGQQAIIEMNNCELASVLALAIGFGKDSPDSAATKDLYAHAEAAMSEVKEPRIFP